MKIPAGRAVLADGAVGTELIARGLPPGTPPAAWNLARPDQVRAVAASYFEAGCEIILTNTFGAGRFQLERHGLDGQTAEINRTAARIVREVCGGSALVSGCVGPSGKFLITEEVSEEELYRAFREQADAQKEGGAEILTVMTMSCAVEMAAAVRAAVDAGFEVIASMTYEKKNGEYRTMMGVSPETAVRAAEDAGASAVGANCGGGVDQYVELVPVLRALTALPVYIKGNAGLPELENGRAVYRMDPAAFASFVPALLEGGADIVGGCCGTGSAHLAAVKPLLDRWNTGAGANRTHA